MRFMKWALFAVMLAVPAVADPLRTITVSGEGAVTVTPDMAVIRVGVTRQAAEASAALDAAAEVARALRARLEEAGVAAWDVQSSQITLNPLWRNRSVTSEGPEISGFAASLDFQVRVRNLPTLGKVLVAAAEDGANSFSGLSFELQDPAPRLAEARNRAVTDAMARAALYARAAGVTLGQVISITEAGVAMPGPVMMEMAAMRSADVPVAAGDMSITAGVSMVFAIGE